MKVLVIDDEQAMHLVMRQLLSQIDGVDVAGCYQHPAEAVEQIRREAIDLVFIDIKIGQDNGLQVARELRAAHRELDIVFVTSHKEYAMDSFDSYPLDYMIKPVSKSRLEQTVARAAARIRERSEHRISNAPLGRLTVRALGGFEVRSGQDRLVTWISKKSMELFAYLLMQRGRPVSKSRIIEHIFSDMPFKNAGTYLNTTVYQLRKALHAHGHKNVIIHSQEQYWLVFDQIEADFAKFEDQVSQFHMLDARELEAALACEQLYIGELFGDRSYEWSLPEQIRLEEMHTRFARQLSRLLLAHHRAEQAIVLIKRLLGSNEWDEEANLLLLQAYGERKDHVSFTRHYEHFTNLYREELSVPLPAEFTRLHQRFGLK